MSIISLRMSPGAHVRGDDVASAGALALGYGDYFDITGNTAISSIATKKPGDQAILYFVTGLTLNHSANLVMPDDANLACPAGSNVVLAEFEEGKWRLISFSDSEVHLTYTEGTFEANVFIDDTPQTHMITNNCTYTRIGRLVTVQGQFIWDGDPEGTGDVRMTNLPYSASGANGWGTAATANVTTLNLPLTCYVAATSPILYFMFDATGGAQVPMNNATVFNGSGVHFTITYSVYVPA